MKTNNFLIKMIYSVIDFFEIFINKYFNSIKSTFFLKKYCVAGMEDSSYVFFIAELDDEEEDDDEEMDDDDEDNDEDDEENNGEENNQESDTKDQIKSGVKSSLMKMIMTNPNTYLILGIVVVVLFIIGLIIVLFPNEFEAPNQILCGGPSKLDNVKVITTDQMGNPLDAWDFYDYVTGVNYNEIGTPGSVSVFIPWQVQGIANVSYALSSNRYSEEAFERNSRNFKKWCPSIDSKAILNEEGKIIKPSKRFYGALECPDWTGDEEIIVIRNSHDNQTACSVETGCYFWSNEYIADVDVKANCVNVRKNRTEGYRPGPMSKMCKIGPKATDESIAKYLSEHPGSYIENGEEGKRVLVTVPAEDVQYGHGPIKDLEIKEHMYKISDTIRGVLMTDREGIPASTEYKSSGSAVVAEGTAACKGTDLYANEPPVRNDMCHNNRPGLNMANQANERGWPVHKILTFWYDYYISSWSDSGISGCQLYYSHATGDLEIMNRDPATGKALTPFNILNILNDKLSPGSLTEEEGIDYVRDYINLRMRGAVLSRGLSTGKGVASAAIELINILEENGYILPYLLGGGHSADRDFDPKTYGIIDKFAAPRENNYLDQDEANAWNYEHFDYITFKMWGGMRLYGTFPEKYYDNIADGFCLGDDPDNEEIKNVRMYFRKKGDTDYEFVEAEIYPECSFEMDIGFDPEKNSHDYYFEFEGQRMSNINGNIAGYPEGPDCTGFSWYTLYNGGLTSHDSFASLVANYGGSGAGTDSDVARAYINSQSGPLMPNRKNVALHGDIIYHPAIEQYVHAKVVIGMLYTSKGVLVGNLVAEAKGHSYGVVVNMVSVENGKPLTKVTTFSGGSETEDPVSLVDYVVDNSVNFPEPYYVIDFSNCYENREPHAGGNGENFCRHVNSSDFYKGVGD